ncbi:MAG: hypothetical protein QXZ17_07915 [Nitrososphaerota archaeon]
MEKASVHVSIAMHAFIYAQREGRQVLQATSQYDNNDENLEVNKNPVAEMITSMTMKYNNPLRVKGKVCGVARGIRFL